MVCRCNLADVEGDGVASLCELGPLGGCPWWLYICSQLGFTSSFCLLLQVKVLGLAGFVYPSSGLLPWQEPSRQISRTEGSYPRQPPKELRLLAVYDRSGVATAADTGDSDGREK
jgi:hypothetical protein